MEDYELVLIREPVRFNFGLFFWLLALGYAIVCVAMLARVYLRVGRRPR